MPAFKPKRPAAHPGLLGQSVADPVTDRALDDVGTAIERLQNTQRPTTRLVVDLALGDNVINHGLGRAPRHAHITPTAANAAFAYALTAADDKRVTINVIGIAQTGAGLELA